GVLGMFGDVVRGAVVGRDQFTERTEAGGDLLEHGPVPRPSRYLLFQPRHAQPGRPPDRAAVERHVPGDGFQQARLAAAVAADERDAFPGVDAKVRVLEERQMTERKVSLLKMKNRHSEQVTARIVSRTLEDRCSLYSRPLSRSR